MSERDNEEAEPVFQPAEFEIHTDDEVPDFSDKGCAWLWTWCIGPIVKEKIDNFYGIEFLWWGELVNLSISWLYGFFRTTWHWKLLLVIWSPAHKKPKKMAWISQLALIPEILVAKIGRFICVTIAQLWRPTARVFVNYVNHRLYLMYSWYWKSFDKFHPTQAQKTVYFLPSGLSASVWFLQFYYRLFLWWTCEKCWRTLVNGRGEILFYLYLVWSPQVAILSSMWWWSFSEFVHDEFYETQMTPSIAKFKKLGTFIGTHRLKFWIGGPEKGRGFGYSF